MGLWGVGGGMSNGNLNVDCGLPIVGKTRIPKSSSNRHSTINFQSLRRLLRRCHDRAALEDGQSADILRSLSHFVAGVDGDVDSEGLAVPAEHVLEERRRIRAVGSRQLFDV